METPTAQEAPLRNLRVCQEPETLDYLLIFDEERRIVARAEYEEDAAFFAAASDMAEALEAALLDRPYLTTETVNKIRLALAKAGRPPRGAMGISEARQ